MLTRGIEASREELRQIQCSKMTSMHIVREMTLDMALEAEAQV
jgi:hypothetical protein